MNSHAPQIRAEYEILNKKKTVIEYPPMQADVVVKIKGKDGEKERRYPFKSFVYNIGHLFAYGFFGTANVNLLKQTSGAAASAGSTYKMKATEAAIADASDSVMGIWIGDINNNSGLSITAAGVAGTIQYTDHTLYRKIINDGGSPDTDTNYEACTVTSVDAYTIKVSRNFTVSRVAGLKISEVGLVVDNGTNKIMVCRDVLVDDALGTAYVSVANGEIITIEYRFTIGSTSGYTTQFLNVFRSLLTETAISSTNTAASTASVDFTAARTNIDAAPATVLATTVTHGILIGGTVSAAPVTNPTLSVGSYVLTNPLSNAQCTTSALTAIGIAYASGQTTFGCYRDFTNDTTNNVYVNEAALYLKHATLTEYFMPVRTLVTNGSLPYQLVQPGETLRIKYYFVLPIGTTQLTTS